MKKETKTLIISMVILATGVTLISGNYIYKLSGSSISNNPSDWGVLGDYVGGTLNPLISLITLFYLIRTYLSQKEELSESGKAAQKSAKTELLKTLISVSYEKISLYRGEMEGVTRTMNGPGGGQKFISMNGKVYDSDSAQKDYRLTMAEYIKNEMNKIDEYVEIIKNLSK